MEQIKGAVDSLLAGLRARMKDGDPEQAVAEVFTVREREHVRFASLDNGKLRLAVDSSAWLFAFNLRKKALAGELSRRVPGIKEIAFFIGRFQ